MPMTVEKGTSGYVVGKATVFNFFPIDLKGRPELNCMQCRFFDRTQGRCHLTGHVSYQPDKWIASDCPFRDEYGGEMEVLNDEHDE